MNSIGVLINFHHGVNIADEIKKVRDLGLTSFQLCIWQSELYTPENAAVICRAVEKFNVPISALWAGWSGPAAWNFYDGPLTLGLIPEKYRRIRLVELMRASEFAELLGVTDVATHVGFLPADPNNADYKGTIGALRILCSEMKKRGQYFLFETGQETPVTLLRAIEDIGTGNVGINLDTANLILYGMGNTADAVDVFGKYVRNTHCKDGLFPTCGRELGVEVPIGQGRADLPTVIKKLNAIGYTGAYTIEREISGEEQVRDIIAARDYIQANLY